MSPTPEHPSQQISGSISGSVGGQAAIGAGINQQQALGDAAVAAVTQAELQQLRGAFADLRAQVEAQAAPQERAAAVERVDELEQAVLADKPDVTTIRYVAQWFGRNLPKLAGAVTTVVVHPLVGRLVEAAGEMLADDFLKLMGADEERP
jgi:hypothetical protein